MASLFMLCFLSLLPFALLPHIGVLDSSHSVDAVDSKFVHDLLNGEAAFDKDGSSAFFQVVPGLMAIALYKVAPCAVALPNTNHNADFLLYSEESEYAQLEFGYVDTESSTIIITNFTRGNTVFMPRGSLHWAINKSCTQTFFGIKFSNSPDDSAVRPDVQIASIPEEILNVSMGEELARQISELSKPDPIVRCPKCMRMCGLV
eukprot:GFUD01028532.1.p1 GENE.GFUD01028532.1~~GFUD01028532.1.p1  ORF type:complete len:204 (-),score=3.59 GFUD01028532.1:66-677(-)